MASSTFEKLGSSSRVGVSWAEGVLRLRDEDLFGEGLGDRCLYFLRHVFTLSEVAWVEVDQNLSTAVSTTTLDVLDWLNSYSAWRRLSGIDCLPMPMRHRSTSSKISN